MLCYIFTLAVTHGRSQTCLSDVVLLDYDGVPYVLLFQDAFIGSVFLYCPWLSLDSSAVSLVRNSRLLLRAFAMFALAPLQSRNGAICYGNLPVLAIPFRKAVDMSSWPGGT